MASVNLGGMAVADSNSYSISAPSYVVALAVTVVDEGVSVKGRLI